MRHCSPLLPAMVGLFLMCGPRTLNADPVVGQIDTFSASAFGWTNGDLAPDPVVIATGGPGGMGDAFLQVTANGSGAGGRLTVFNRAQWTGNFLAAGVGAVEMDLL